MNLNKFKPTKQLAPYVKEYLIIESQEDITNRVLASTSIAVSFRYSGHINYIENNSMVALPLTTISGLRKAVRLINYLPYTSNLIVLFKETGATAFFRDPLYELFEESTSLENFTNLNELRAIEEQLYNAHSHNQRIELVEKFLISKINHPKPDQLTSVAIRKIYAANGLLKMKDLAHSLCCSQDAFEKRFRRVTGASPKQFSSIVRLKSIIAQKQKNNSLINMALQAEYYDQPHFNKEFKLFTGLTPTEFFKAPLFW